MADTWEKLENDILVNIEKKLEERVKGQDEALSKVKTVITRAVKGLSGLQHSGASHKPKGILFFEDVKSGAFVRQLRQRSVSSSLRSCRQKIHFRG